MKLRPRPEFLYVPDVGIKVNLSKQMIQVKTIQKLLNSFTSQNKYYRYSKSQDLNLRLHSVGPATDLPVQALAH
jgi:hypothetical protein